MKPTFAPTKAAEENPSHHPFEKIADALSVNSEVLSETPDFDVLNPYTGFSDIPAIRCGQLLKYHDKDEKFDYGWNQLLEHYL